MKVTLIDSMGSDLSVVNAARVSFAKESYWDRGGREGEGIFKLKEGDARLISYLARHNHWTPFGHTAVTLHVKAPIFVARQLGKHQVGLVWNEVSRRYVTEKPEFYFPTEGWRRKPEGSVKQGSGDVIDDDDWVVECDKWYSEIALESLKLYDNMISRGVCAEQARMVLPQSMYTEWYWTGNIAAFARVCNLRLDLHTQKETRDIAKDISGLIEPIFPVSWKALMSNES